MKSHKLNETPMDDMIHIDFDLPRLDNTVLRDIEYKSDDEDCNFWNNLYPYSDRGIGT